MAKRRDALNHMRHAAGGTPRDAAAFPVAGRRLPVLAWWYPVALVALVVLAYANGLSGPFIFDDKLTVVENRHIRDLTSLWSLLLPERELPIAGRPVANISFALNYAVHGLSIPGYRVVNIALHLLCGLLVLGVVRRSLGSRVCHEPIARTATPVAFAAAALWVTHPLNSEAVSYLTQRTELLMALCYLATLYAAIRAAGPRRRSLWTLAAIVAAVAGMGSKESMVTAPVVVALYDRVFLYRSFREAAASRWRLYAGLAGTWIVLALLQSTGPRMYSAGFAAGVSPWTYLLNQSTMILRYLRLAVWPDALVLNYGLPQPLALTDVMPQFAAITLLFAASVFALIRWPPVGFLGAWFFLTLAPTSSIVPIVTEVGAERRMYLPSVAVTVALALAVLTATWAFTGRRTADEDADREAVQLGSVPTPAVVMLLLAVGVFAAATMRRNQEYGSALVLAQTSDARWPTPVAQHMVATELALVGREEESLELLRASAKGYPRGNYDLGIALFRKGEYADAVRAFDAFVAEFPLLVEVVEARALAGRALVELRKWPEAIAAFQGALRMRPSRADLHGALADAFVMAQRPADAVEHYRRFLVAYPNDAAAIVSLGLLLVDRGELREATDLFRRAVVAAPESAAARRNLAGILMAQRDFGGAIEHARQAAALAPTDPLALDLLGVVLINDGRTAEAVRAFEQATQLAPGDGEIRAHLQAAQTLARARPGAIHP